jgi:hypothetical protein
LSEGVGRLSKGQRTFVRKQRTSTDGLYRITN